MRTFRCGHPHDERNGLLFNSGRKNGMTYRCRICYNALRKRYQRRRLEQARLDRKDISK